MCNTWTLPLLMQLMPIALIVVFLMLVTLLICDTYYESAAHDKRMRSFGFEKTWVPATDLHSGYWTYTFVDQPSKTES